MQKKYRICFLASNNLQNDPRVQKQAKGAAKHGYESIAIGFYWIAPGLELPEKEQMDGYEIQRVLYQPTKIIRSQPDALAIISGIFWRLVLSLLWFRTIGLFKVKSENDRRLHKEESESIKNSQTNKPPKSFLGKIFGLAYSARAKFQQLGISWYGTFDYYTSMTIGLADKAIELEPNIVHCNDLDSLWAGYLVKQKTGAKLVFDAHEFWLDMGLKVPRPYIFAFKLSEKYLLKKIDGYVTVNQPILEKTESYYGHKFTVPATVIYNCPNYEEIKFAKPNQQKIKILYQGRYALNRGLEQLTESARYLPENAEISFRAIKDPAIEKKLIDITKQYRVESKVKFLNAAPMNAMVKAAKSADIGVIPYVPVHIDNQLCSPNKLFEYMMAGLALAVSDLPVLRYFVKKYKNGVLFNPRSPQSIAQALNYLISHPEELSQMKRNSLKAAEELNWEKEQKKLINIYRTIIN